MSVVQLSNINYFDKLIFGKAPQPEKSLGDRLVQADVISRRQRLKAVDYQEENEPSLVEALNNLKQVEKTANPLFSRPGSAYPISALVISTSAHRCSP